MRLLFIVNAGSGNSSTDWPSIISNYFTPTSHIIDLYELPNNINLQGIIKRVEEFSPERVIAVGGDGTVKLVAECLLKKDIALGILPAGSANGLAKELGINQDPLLALDTIVNGSLRKIHVVRVNNEYCIHLSDIGLNAYAMKRFEMLSGRGMWGYLKASVAALQKHPVMNLEIKLHNKMVKVSAYMIVIANATQYGTGALINPIGSLDDDVFEVIVIKKVSMIEIFKMMFFHTPFNTEKTEIFQTNTLIMRSRRKVHFQIDGEYIGMVKEVSATVIPDAIKVIMPQLASL